MYDLPEFASSDDELDSRICKPLVASLFVFLLFFSLEKSQISCEWSSIRRLPRSTYRGLDNLNHK